MFNTRDICEVALLSASLTVAKLCLSAIANIEIVTLLIITYGLSVGFKKGLIATFVFTTIEFFIWGFGIWIILYYIYWPTLLCVIALIKKRKFAIVYSCIIGVIMTVCFGLLSTLLESLTLSAGQTFKEFFIVRYIAGVPLFLTHIICNAVVLPLGLYPLKKIFDRVNKRPIVSHND